LATPLPQPFQHDEPRNLPPKTSAPATKVGQKQKEPDENVVYNALKTRFSFSPKEAQNQDATGTQGRMGCVHNRTWLKIDKDTSERLRNNLSSNPQTVRAKSLATCLSEPHRVRGERTVENHAKKVLVEPLHSQKRSLKKESPCKLNN
jgi:hypothetical protein